MTREYSEGSVVKHQGRWRCVIDWYDEDGARHRATKMTDVRCYPDTQDATGSVLRNNRGRSSALSVLSAWRSELVAAQAGDRAQEVPAASSFEDYADSYIDYRRATAAVSAHTIDRYRSFMFHIRGTDLGRAGLSEITPRMVMGWERQLHADGLSATSVSHLHVFAKQVMSSAVRLGDADANPFDAVDAPRRARRPVNSLDEEGVRRCMEALGLQGPTPFSCAVALALMCGMRQGEICALRWRDVDLTGRTIHVVHALARESGHYLLSDPKTAASRRSIPFGETLAAHLEARASAALAELGTRGLDPDLYVVGCPTTGRWMNPNVLGKEWRTFSRMLGLVGTAGERPTFHDLRHTFATIAIGSGTDVKTVSAVLGHTSAAMTLDIYADALASSKRLGMEALDEVFSL